MAEYKKELTERYWAYQRTFFPKVDDYFDQPNTGSGRPPVFRREEAWRNVIFNRDASPAEKASLLRLLPSGDRHKWFGSMNSSQALAQSVFGNLALYGHLGRLAELSADNGQPLFAKAELSAANFSLEQKVKHLGEPRPTSLDGYVTGEYQVAIECKFTEAEVGACSRPLLPKSASNYETAWCNGSYSKHQGRTERCSLTQIGVSYWKYAPALFHWDSENNIDVCPMNKSYQLIRNIIAVCVRPDGTLAPKNGHAVLIYDKRNPAFQEGGNGLDAFKETEEALRDKTLLRKCSWQRIVGYLKDEKILPWLTDALYRKYGLE